MNAIMQNRMKFQQRNSWRLAALTSIVVAAIALSSSCSQERTLKELFQTELDSLQMQYQFPGATAAYVLQDGTVGEFAVGLADIEQAIPMRTQSRMLAASIGKTFVGATILALAEDRLLALDDPLSKWLGGRSWYDRLPNHDSITLRQLLNHTSGLPNHVENEQFGKAFMEIWRDTESTLSPEELIAFILEEPPLFAAGKGWSYTDTGYLLLGLVIEEVTGNRWYDEVGRRFLEPLNLLRTTPSDHVNLPGLAAGYMSEDNPFGLPTKTTSEASIMVWNPSIESAGGGFVSNSKDLAVWAKVLYEGRAMEGDYLKDLLHSVPVSEHSPQTRYGSGVAIHSEGPFGSTYGHGGWIPGYISSLRYYSDLGISVAFQINTDIGIVDGSSQLVEDMERRLIGVLASYEEP